VLTDAGRGQYEAARPHLEAAVGKHLLDRLGSEDSTTLFRVLQRLT
jgi:DNA-binding MarR family transcriptional regulator